jgi:arabinogalactan oligomer / maltooligosaccharide transport system permease protein
VKTREDAVREAVELAALAEWDPTARRRAFLSLCLVPALVFLVLALVYPLFYNVFVSLSDAGIYNIRDWRITGLKQYLLVFSDPVFWTTFSRTVLWTAMCTSLQVLLGVVLAAVLHQDFVRGRPVWRLLLLLPWAMPQYIMALTWRGMFARDEGAVNAVLALFAIPAVDWLHSPAAAFLAMVLVNVWMGFPFMMVVALTGMRSIPDSVYEAAQLEGAGWWWQFTQLTAPLLRPVMLPATTLGIIWNFNSLNLVWLFTDGGAPADSTHILSSYVYKTAFTYYRFGWSAALSVVIFAILFLAVQGLLQAGRLRR